MIICIASLHVRLTSTLLYICIYIYTRIYTIYKYYICVYMCMIYTVHCIALHHHLTYLHVNDTLHVHHLYTENMHCLFTFADVHYIFTSIIYTKMRVFSIYFDLIHSQSCDMKCWFLVTYIFVNEQFNKGNICISHAYGTQRTRGNSCCVSIEANVQLWL